MSTAQQVIDDIDALVDEQLRQEASGYDHNLNQPRCRCGAEWHGIAMRRCPGTDAEGPLVADVPPPVYPGLYDPYSSLLAAIRSAQIPRRPRDAYSLNEDGTWPRLGTIDAPDQRLYRSTTENIRIDHEQERLDPYLDAYEIDRGTPALRQRYSITCLDCRQAGRLTPTASGWYTVYDEAVMECAFRDGPPCEHWELVGA